MIQRAIVEQVIDAYSVRVRIPMYNKAAYDPTATPTNQLYIATILTFPGCYPAYQPGDVVIMAFENEVVSQPTILGLLYRKDMNTSVIDINAGSIRVSVDAELPQNTSIGSTDVATLEQVAAQFKNGDPLTIEQGGTGAVTAEQARENLGIE